jgi:microcystin-dependent protein
MARCSCSGTTCGCVIQAGAGITTEGSGSARDPYIITAEGGGGGGGGWDPGDLKDTTRSSTPAGWLECNGQPVSRTSYAALFAAIGTQWGAGNGFSTFNVPDFRGRFRLGVGADYPMAASGGTDATVLGVANLPAHTHTIAHTHTMAHTHSISHDHANAVVASAGVHNHQYRRWDDGTIARGTGSDRPVNVPGSGPLGDTSTDGAHTHVVNVPGFVGNSGASSAASTGGSSAPNSGSTGNGSAFTNMPPYRAVRVLVKT